MEIKGIFLTPIYLLLVYFIANRYKRKHIESNPALRYFIPALTVKILGALMVGFVYQFYWSGGDTFAYYYASKTFINYLFEDTGQALRLFTSNNPLEFYDVLGLRMQEGNYDYILKGTAEQMTIKVTTIINLIGFNSYLTSSILFAFISFSGLWALYVTFLKKFPSLEKELAIAIFFVPSVFFWGSGILKDTIALTCVGWLTYGIYHLFVARRKIIFSIIVIVISVYVLSHVRGYVLYGLVPAAVFWLIQLFKNAIRAKFLRVIITPVLLGIAVGAGALLIVQIGSALGRFSIENLESVARGYQNWHAIASAQGSGYSLGEISFTPGGMLSKLPAAVNVTLFRPYLWEAGSPINLISALENLVILFFTLKIVLRVNPFRFFKIIFSNPTTLFCLIFTLIIAFAVGITSNNFGALVRYKVVCIPFYLSLLFMVHSIYKEKYAHKKELKLRPSRTMFSPRSVQ